MFCAGAARGERLPLWARRQQPLARTYVQGVRVDGERVEDGHADRCAALRRARAEVIRKLAPSDGLVRKEILLRARRQAREAFAFAICAGGRERSRRGMGRRGH